MYKACSTDPLHLPECSILLPPISVFNERPNAIPDGFLHSCSQLNHTRMRAHIAKETEHDWLILACYTNRLCHNARTLFPADKLFASTCR